MKKIDTVFSPEKMDVIRKIRNDYSISEIILSEVKVYNPDITRVKKYRGAEYRMDLFTKLKAEIIVEDNQVEELYNIIQEKIVEKEDGDSCYIYELIK